MVDAELSVLYRNLNAAVCAEDLFGVPPNISLENKQKLTEIIKNIYRRLAQIAHPDHHRDAPSRELAQEAFVQLNRLYHSALTKIEKGIYGQGFSDQVEESSREFRFHTTRREYHIDSTLAQGDLATIYHGKCSSEDSQAGEIAVKVVEDPADNDLMRDEIRTLRLLHAEPGVYSKHLPVVLDDFKTTENQMATVMRRIDGYDLCSIREKYQQGIPARHIIWIFRRVLSVLGYAHSKGFIHGNIEPAHIMVRPQDHNVYLIDWCYSIFQPARTRQGFKCLNEDYSPPEVAQGKPPIPASDLYSLGKSMIYLLGGNIKTSRMPKAVDERIQRFIKFFCRASALQRPQDAWEMYGKLDDLREEVYGPHKFIEFVM